jgi:hypothetical protein
MDISKRQRRRFTQVGKPQLTNRLFTRGGAIRPTIPKEMENIQTATVNEWWKALAMDVKSLITGIYEEDEADIFWRHLFVSDKQNIYQWRQAEAGNTDLAKMISAAL